MRMKSAAAVSLLWLSATLKPTQPRARSLQGVWQAGHVGEGQAGQAWVEGVAAWLQGSAQQGRAQQRWAV
jgi:hypothetical protein